MELHNIRIESNDGITAQVFIDNVEVNGVQSFDINMDAESDKRCPELTLKIIPNKLEISVLGEVCIQEATLQ